MSYVIHLQISPKVEAWHTGHAETANEAEAQAFATEEQANAHLDLCGLYRLMEWKATVRKSKTPVNVPGPGSSFTYENWTATKKVEPKSKPKAARSPVKMVSVETAPKATPKKAKGTEPKQLKLF